MYDRARIGLVLSRTARVRSPRADRRAARPRRKMGGGRAIGADFSLHGLSLHPQFLRLAITQRAWGRAQPDHAGDHAIGGERRAGTGGATIRTVRGRLVLRRACLSDRAASDVAARACVGHRSVDDDGGDLGTARRVERDGRDAVRRASHGLEAR